MDNENGFVKSDSERGARLILAGLTPRIDSLQSSLAELKDDFKTYCKLNTDTYIGVLTRLALVEAEAKGIKETLVLVSGITPSLPIMPKSSNGPDWPRIIVAVAIALSIILSAAGIVSSIGTSKVVKRLAAEVQAEIP